MGVICIDHVQSFVQEKRRHFTGKQDHILENQFENARENIYLLRSLLICRLTGTKSVH